MLLSHLFLLRSYLSLSSLYSIKERPCSHPATKWEKHLCSIVSNDQKYQKKCIPEKKSPQSGLIKGLVLMFHGWTACPDAFEPIASELSSNGFITLTPLLPGQGINIGYGCDVPDVCVEHGTNPSELPESKEGISPITKGYIDFVNWAIEMVNEELNLIPISARDRSFYVSVFGLSGGGPMATVIWNLI